MRSNNNNFNNDNLREVGALPEDTSRGVWAVKVPETVTRGVGILGALGATRKIITVYTDELIWPLLVTLFLAARMRI